MVKIICSEVLEGKILATGFLGLGHVGFLSIDHVIKFLNARKVGFIDTLHVPPFINVKGDRFTTPYEIYAHDRVILIRFESIPSGRAGSSLMRGLVQWAKKGKAERMILIGGLNVSFRAKDEETMVRYLCNTTWKEKYDIIRPVVQDGVQVVGPLALLLNYGEIYRLSMLALLAYADPGRVDPRAAANAAKALGELLNVKIGIEDLVDKAEYIEREMERRAAEVYKETDLYGDASMYA